MIEKYINIIKQINIMKKFYFGLMALVALFSACSSGGNSSTEEENIVKPVIKKEINFRGNIKPTSRATETAFESGDQISVFAVKPSNEIKLLPEGNYVDNARYIYQGSYFETTDPITLSEDDTKGLAYYAIYPYYQGITDAFVFVMNEDQSTHSAYTASDLCTAFRAPTTDKTVNLEFNHRLSNIVVKFYGTNLTNKNISVKLNNVQVSCAANINANTFEGIGERFDVTMGEESANTFHAIIAPQTIKKGERFLTITINDKEYEMSLEADMTLKSGKQVVFEYEINDDIVIELNGYINPWNTEDPRFNDVVPDDIEEELNKYIPIYPGVNPPAVEGTYFIDPFVTVYCEDEGNGGYDPGDIVTSEYIHFFNQNSSDNTLDIEKRTVSGSSSAKGTGAFISGEGNNFTAFFNTEGESSGIYTKTALVISGTKTSDGIKDLHYAFVMVEKGDDPNDKLMEEGVYRVFKDKDGLSVNSSWNGYSLSRSVINELRCDMYNK